jgi:surfactin family lipopeptide synthetase A
MLSKDQIALVANQKLKEKEFWLKQFSLDGETTAYPYDFLSNEKADYDELKLIIESSTLTKLIELSKQNDLRLFITLSSVLSILLYKSIGRENLIFGCPVISNPKPKYNQILPIVLTIDSELSVKDFLNKVKAILLGSIEHQEYPVEFLFNKVHPSITGDLSLFDVGIALDGLQNKDYLLQSKLNLIFSFVLSGSHVYGSLIYNNKRYKRETVNSIAHHYNILLGHLLGDLTQKVSSLKIISDDERSKILDQFNNTSTVLPEEPCFSLLFEKQAAKTPYRIALKHNLKELTYKDLNERSNQLANYLIEKGIQEGAIVGLLMDRSVYTVQSILALWKIRAAYLPIDPNYPEKRILEILKDSGTTFLLTTCDKNVFNQERFDGTIIQLDEDRQLIEEESCQNLGISGKADDLAYVIYTSGSTGTPKGVMIEHIGMINHLYAKINDLSLEEHCLIAQNASYTFDISVWQFFASMTVGGKTIIYDNNDILNPEVFLNKIKTDMVTILEVVPSYLAVVIDLIESSGKNLKCIKYLLVTGEELKASLSKRWFKVSPGIPLVNAYGPTEASDDITHYIFDKYDSTRIPIGKPIQNMNIYVVDRHMNLCPVGIKGEICVSGIGVGKGYLNNEKKTNEVFIKDPFKSEENLRLYKTGDLGRWLPDGNIEFFGRKDHQVKIRGFRIELGEIEQKILEHPGVKEGVVIDKEAGENNKVICAYYTGSIDGDILKSHLSSQLPEYMIPAYFFHLEALPLTPNGKVDRTALLKIEIEAKVEYAPPVTPAEKGLVAIWADLLGIEEKSISRYDNFFELGGNSLSVIKLVSVIHNQLNKKVEIKDVFDKGTVKELGEIIDHLQFQKYLEIKPAEKRAYYELSHAQRRLYILQQLESEGLNNNISEAFIIKGNLEIETFKKALQSIVERHEILRTVFQVIDEVPRQVIKPSIDTFFYYIIIDDDSKLKEHVNSVARTKFNLSEGPLFNTRLIKMSDDHFAFAFAIHHIIADAQSLQVLREELAESYHRIANNITGELKPLSIQYKDYSEWQNSLLEDSQSDDRKFWTKTFENFDAANGIIADSDAKASTKAFEISSLFIDEDLSLKINTYVKEQNSTLFIMFLSLVNLLVSKINKKEEVILGTYTLGRSHAELEKQIGFYVNTIPVLTKVDVNKSFHQFLSGVKNGLAKLLDHEMYPYDQILQDLKYGNKKLINIVVTAINDYKKIDHWGNLAITPFEVDYQFRFDFDITFVVQNLGKHINLAIVYNSSMYKPETIRNIESGILMLAQSAIEKPDVALKNHEYQSDSQKVRAYWANYLKGYNGNFLLPGRENPSKHLGNKIESLEYALDLSLLKGFEESNGPLPLIPLLAVLFALGLKQYSNEKDIVCAVGAANSEENLSEQVFPVRIRLDEYQSFAELVDATTDAIALNQAAFSPVPGDLLEEWKNGPGNIFEYIILDNLSLDERYFHNLFVEYNPGLILALSREHNLLRLKYLFGLHLPIKSVESFNSYLIELFTQSMAGFNKPISNLRVDLEVDVLEDLLDQYLKN